MASLVEPTAGELLAGFRARDFSPVEVVAAVAERIEAMEPLVHAFTTLALELARDEAVQAERAYATGTPRPLEGIPFGVKDLFDTEGVRTTYGSLMFDDHLPERDAEAVRRARAAGAILIGKTSTHEFAWGITSVNPRQGSPRNPWALERMSGGSSGGSAVALAVCEVPLALGSDTGGSIRVPAAFCGVVGLKPTYGRISTAGVLPLARSLDHPGPMARTAADAALLLGVIAGHDPADPATEDVPLGDLENELDGGLGGLRVAVCPDLHRVPLAPDLQAVFDEAVRAVESVGAELVEVELPEAERIYETFGVIQRAEALFTHETARLWPDRRDEYGDDVRGRLELATKVTLRDYLAASAERQRIRAGFARLFGEVDLLLTPVSGVSPLPIGEESAEFRELVMSYTTPQDLVGIPACAVPAGFDALGIPVGVQFSGPPCAEGRVLRAAQAFQQATDWHERRPELRPAEKAAR